MNRLHKTIISSLLVLAALFSLAGCKTNTSPSEQVPEEHFFNIFNSACVKHGDHIYIIDRLLFTHDSKKVLYCIDTSSGEAFPLCFKPECTHDTSECGALLGGGTGYAMNLMLYNERLYWIVFDRSKYTLRSMDLDGSDLRIDTELDTELAKLAFGYGTAEIDNGVLYVCGSSVDVENAAPIHRGIVYCQPISGGKATEILRVDGDFLHLFGNVFGDHFYFGVCDSQNYIEPPPERHPLSLYSYDIGSGEKELLVSSEVYGYCSDIIMPDQDTLILSHMYGDVLRYSISTKELSVIFSPMELLGRRPRSDVAEDRISILTSDHRYVIDFDGNCVFDEDLDLERFVGEDVGTVYVGSSGNDAYYYLLPSSQIGCYLIRIDLYSGEMTVVWHGEMPMD